METIQYRGAYRFTDRAALDRALSAALMPHADWHPQFRAAGSSLTVVLDLPRRQAQAAAVVMQMLAGAAIEGIVVARQHEVAVDVFYAAS